MYTNGEPVCYVVDHIKILRTEYGWISHGPSCSDADSWLLLFVKWKNQRSNDFRLKTKTNWKRFITELSLWLETDLLLTRREPNVLKKQYTSCIQQFGLVWNEIVGKCSCQIIVLNKDQFTFGKNIFYFFLGALYWHRHVTYTWHVLFSLIQKEEQLLIC